MNEKKIGIFLFELRKEKGMTQEELATRLHVDRGTISKWERGVYLPKPDLLLKLSKLFNISVNEILLGERKTKENEQEVENIAIDVMNKNRKKTKRIFLFGISIILILMIFFGMVFCGTYFIKNYDSISVHCITGENEDFKLYDTIIFISKDHSYLLVGGIKNYSDNKIYSIDIYYKKNNEKIIVTRQTGITSYGDEIYRDLRDFNQNLYIDITYGKNRKETQMDTIKLSVSKEYSNSYFFNQKKVNVFSQ